MTENGRPTASIRVEPLYRAHDLFERRVGRKGELIERKHASESSRMRRSVSCADLKSV
jgi:hypothetical protein